MKTWVSRHLWMKRGTEQGSFTDSNDSPIVERRYHLYSRADLLNGWPANKDRVKRRFSQPRHQQISLKTFPLTAKRIATGAYVHRGQQWLARQRIIRRL